MGRELADAVKELNMSGDKASQNCFKTALLRVCLHVLKKQTEVIAANPDATAAMLSHSLPTLADCKRAAVDSMLEENGNAKKKVKKNVKTT